MAILAATLAVLACPRPAAAWRYGWAYSPGVYAGSPWGPAPLVLFPAPAPSFGYRFSLPSGAPLSFDDPQSGTTYCLSRSTGFYFVCGYAASIPDRAAPVSLVPAAAAAPLVPQAPAPASGILLFRLPPGSEAAVDGVPIGLSDGLGVASVQPGKHRVMLRVSAAEAQHLIDVSSHRIFTITPTGVVPNEP